jgi:hypothetical protein
LLEFLRKQWKDIKGHAKWALLGLVWTLLWWLATHLMREIPSVPHWLVIAVPFVLSVVAFVWLGSRSSAHDSQKPSSAGQATTTALTTVPSTFDVTTFLANAYNSPLAGEVENNVRQAVETRYREPEEREDFLLKFIGIGTFIAVYDIAWASIFKSQVLLLEELNRKSRSLDEARVFYTKAAQQNPPAYANYSFDQWLGFLRGEVFILQQGTMIGITQRGKDFLKYLVHCGRSANDRFL